jgi:hypothetical protein
MQITKQSYSRTNNPKKLPIYNGQPKVKNTGVQEAYTQWELEEFKKCKASPEYFIENYIVLEGEKGSEKFELYDYQRDTITDIKENRYTIILAPRRAGKSLCLLGYIVWFAIFNSHKNIYVLSKTHDDSKLLLSKVKLMYESLPFFLQPGVENYAVEKVELSNGTKIITSPSKGVRGDDADFLYCVSGDTTITIKDKYGNIKELIISEAEKLYSNKKNKEHNAQILTKDGFQDFDGIQCNGFRSDILKITFGDNTSIKCTSDHRFLLDYSNEYIEAYLLHEGVSLSGKIIVTIEESEPELVYDAINVKNGNNYVTNGIISHNCDEFAFLPASQRFWQSTYPIIARRKDAKVCVTSTPDGMGNEYYNLWSGAVQRTNHFLPIKWRWQDVPGYDEKFKQETIANIGQERWDTEFECKFLTGSKTLIDGQVLARLDTLEPIKTYSKNFKVYEEPKPKSKYILSVDVGDGVGKDYSVVTIIDISMKPYKVVMTYRDNKVSPFELDTIVVMWAKRYNNGFVVVETNNRGADVANRILNDHFYENIFIKDASKPTGYGIDVKETNKKKGCSILKNMIETNMLVVNDGDTIRELKTFEIAPNGSYKAATGLHDDTVMALVVFCILTSEPIFIDLQGSDKDINDTIKEIKIASLPQEFMLEGFITNYSDPFSDVKNYADYFSRGNDGQYDGLNYYNNDWE